MIDEVRYGTIDRDYAATLAGTTPDDDGAIWMVNLMKYRDVADYPDGRPSTISGREADDIYAPLDVLTAIGAEIVFVADVEQQLLGDQPQWDRIAVVRYPNRRAFVDMQGRPDYLERHVHKDAGMETTIISGCQPIGGLDGHTTDWSEVAHPPTEADGPVVVLHVLKFDETSAAGVTPDEMVAYQNAASKVAGAHGGRVNGWFAVEGTVVGDGRSWDQMRFNEFPSKAAFMAVVTDPARLEAQKTHREVALADTYTMILRPVVNRLADSIETE